MLHNRRLDVVGCTEQHRLMKLVNIDEAREQFSKLIDEAEAGEEIVFARNGLPVVRLVTACPPQRRLGRWQGTVPQLSEAEWTASDLGLFAPFEE
ncbi:MAG TPA: type II toxin-antitoxin system prevent-host-death family antitoxin [Polyangiaceae bacterium]|nr:type II toxin-antitoxin system prevent-host-death family antitoxin [Polyangiaceae bacterium]